MTADTSQYVHRDDGHDGSHYQPDAGPMDLAAVHAIPMDWLGWKTTQSVKGVDASFPEVDTLADVLGFRWFLPYHWLSSTTDPLAQADHYLAHYGRHRPGKGKMLDAEEAGITVDKCLTWLEHVEDDDRRPASVYTGLYVAGGTIWRSDAIRNSKYGPRHMHLAAYITAQGLIVRLQALGLLELALHMWQWSSNGILTTGQHIPGITGRADLNTVVTPSMMDLACGITALPPPPLEDDMTEIYYVVTGANAKFIGTPAKVRWTGPGDGKIEAAIATQLAAGNLKQVDLTGGPNAFAATFLEGPLPTGDGWAWTGDEFANTNEIKARASQPQTKDQVARDGVTRLDALVVALNDATGRNGQEIHEVRVGLGKLAPT